MDEFVHDDEYYYEEEYIGPGHTEGFVMPVPQHDPWDGEYDEYEYCEDNSEDIGPRSADRHVSFFHFCCIKKTPINDECQV